MANPIPVDTGFYESPTKTISIQDCVNLFPYNAITKNASSPGVLLSTPGSDPVLATSESILEAILFDGKIYQVETDGSFYQLESSDGFFGSGSTITKTLLGVVDTNSYTPQIKSNGSVICIQVPEGNGYFYDSTSGFRQITNSVYVAYQSEGSGVLGVTSQDGYFLFCTQKTFFHTDSVDSVTLGTDFPALAFAAGEDRPDDNMRPFSFKGDVILFGTQSYEVWRNVGTEPFAFARIEGATKDKGLSGYGLVTLSDNTFYFMGAGPGESVSVWRASDGSPQYVSTPAIDQVLGFGSSAASIPRSKAWSFSLDGFMFVGFDLPGIMALESTFFDATLVYCINASALQGRPVWTRWKSAGSDSYSANSFIRVYEKIFAFGDDGITRMSFSTYTENEHRVTRFFTGSYIQNQPDSLFITRVKLRTEKAPGLTEWDAADQDKNPKMQFEYTRDNGDTWIDKGQKPLGSLTGWSRLGRIYNQTAFRFTFETKVKVAVQDLHIEAGAAANGY